MKYIIQNQSTCSFKPISCPTWWTKPSILLAVRCAYQAFYLCNTTRNLFHIHRYIRHVRCSKHLDFFRSFFFFLFFNNEGVALIGSECKHRNETILGIHFHEYSTAGNQLDQDKAWQIENIIGVYIRQLCAYWRQYSFWRKVMILKSINVIIFISRQLLKINIWNVKRNTWVIMQTCNLTWHKATLWLALYIHHGNYFSNNILWSGVEWVWLSSLAPPPPAASPQTASALAAAPRSPAVNPD